MAFVRFGWILDGLLIILDTLDDFDAGPRETFVYFEI